jgi:predicted RecB family nuclease
MRLVAELLRLSATDLANHLSCVHLSELERAVAEGRARKPRRSDPIVDLLTERGREHEIAYLEHLRAQKLGVVEIRSAPGAEDVAATLAAMRDGADVIYQAPLGDAHWYGRADFLLKIATPSDLGAWSYEAVDAKLATETRAGTILQLCVYSTLIERLQGARPESAHVVAPHHRFEPESYRLDDFRAYYRLVAGRLEAALAVRSAVTYPEPAQHCDVCNWWSECNARRRGDDHLCFVAGISRLQIKELRTRLDVSTLERLGDLEPVPKPTRGSREALERVRDQAAIQLKARRLDGRQHEVLPLSAEHGFLRMPEPARADLFLDLEGDRLAPDGGREYLFGVSDTRDGYTPLWATNPAEEKRAFELVVDRIIAAFTADPAMHVYHFGAYEPTAFKRLSGRYATRESELDTLLRAELFVDLHSIVKHSLRASVETYSLKDLEQFYGLERMQDLREATAARRVLEWAIEMREELGLNRTAVPAASGTPQLSLGLDEGTTPSRFGEQIASVERYNRDDCISTARLRDWLEELRAMAEQDQGWPLARPEPLSGQASERVAEAVEETQRVMTALLDGVPIDAAERSEEQQARWLIAQLLEWHRREEKAAWWEYFRLRDLPLEDYEDERSALARLTFLGTVGGTVRRPVHRYSFPPQDQDMRRGDEVCVPPDGQSIGKIEALDIAGHTLDIEHAGRYADLKPERLFVRRQVSPRPKPAVLLELGRWIAAHGMDAQGPHRAARDLLLRRPPRVVAGSRGLADEAPKIPTDTAHVITLAAARSARERQRAAAATPRGSVVDAEVRDAIRLGFELDHGVLPIQGPPGTGKTFTGSHMILELVKAGKKVGVTAVGHETIRNVLRAVCTRATEQGIAGFQCLHKGKPKDDNPPELHAVDDNARVAAELRGSAYSLLGGTSWLWANELFRDSVDVLFIDEAGQMSLADVLAVSVAAKSLVLLGDPQQLEQPQQASHPPGAGASALEHLLGGAKTIAADRGLFLHQTRRLHPDICQFTAEAFYEDRLTSFPGLERQAVLAPVGSAAAAFGSAGLVYLPVEHDGNQSRAAEEVDAIAAVVEALTADGVTYRNAAGDETPLTRADLMIVAPYNAQVTALAERLRDVRVGTVDKFQGQQAPVVIVSLTTSTPEDAPRGMDFLYSANRLNVATSRAKALCILVGNPPLFEPDCRTPREMRLANAFCRYRELARELRPLR